MSSRLGSLSLTGTGVEVAFNAHSLSKEEEKTLKEEAKAAFIMLNQEPSSTASEARVLLGSASRSFQNDLVSYITSIGFSPIQPTGAELLRPGTVLRLEQGRPIFWATSTEAFPRLQVTESSLAIPKLSQYSKTAHGGTEIKFECIGGSKVENASLLALSTSMSDNVRQSLASNADLRVVQSIIVCTGFAISAITKGKDVTDEDALRYPEGSRLVLGIKMATLQPQKGQT